MVVTLRCLHSTILTIKLLYRDRRRTSYLLPLHRPNDSRLDLPSRPTHPSSPPAFQTPSESVRTPTPSPHTAPPGDPKTNPVVLPTPRPTLPLDPVLGPDPTGGLDSSQVKTYTPNNESLQKC